MAKRRVVPLHKRRWFLTLKQGMEPLNFVPVLLFVIQVIVMVICVISSYEKKGDGGIVLGIFSVLALFSCIAGLIVSVKGIRKRRKNKFWSYLGLICQLLFLIFIIWVFITGVRSLI